MKILDSNISHATTRRTYACVRCYDRKVKCDGDKHSPCSACVKHNADCIFRPPPSALRKKRRRVKDHQEAKRLQDCHAPSPQQDFHNSSPRSIAPARNATNPSLSENPENDNCLQLPTPASTTSDRDRCTITTQLVGVPGRSKLVDNSLWTRVVEEVHDAEEALEDDSYDATDAEASEDDLSYVFGASFKSNDKVPHPSSEQILELWQIFKTNVDPITKIVHVPTLGVAVQKAIKDIAHIPKSFEALLFSIYTIAVVSLTDDECRHKFGQSRKVLQNHYISATRAALTRANFVGTVSLVVLQALVFHLMSLRDVYDPRKLWTLTGVALRIAEGMGLNRDGEELGVSPFESEMRRRVWWHLKMHDFRTAELSGLPKFRGVESLLRTCKAPKNINDNDLYPAMTSPPAESTKVTDMIFCASRIEFFGFGLKQISLSNDGHPECMWEDSVFTRALAKGRFIAEAEALLESKYLRYCDPSQPVELMTMICSRAALNVGRFISHHPRAWPKDQEVPEAERQYVWNVCIKLLEQYDVMQSNPHLQCFAWNVSYYLQWHSIIHVLDSIRARPLGSDADKAWDLIQKMYKNNPEIVSNTKQAIYVAVGNLCLKAYAAREAAIKASGAKIGATPDYITKLRQQRELAKATRQARLSKRGQKPITDAHDKAKEYGQKSEYERNQTDETYQFNPSSQTNPLLQHSNLEQFSNSMDPSIAWSSNEFDSLLGTSTNMINIDTDLMLAQDQSPENTTGQPIDWMQWDAWVGNLNIVPASWGIGAFNDFS